MSRLSPEEWKQTYDVDGFSGLPNLLGFLELSDNRLASAQSVIAIELSGFSRVSLKEKRCIRYLQVLAECIKTTLRNQGLEPESSAFRIGLEEFLILVPCPRAKTEQIASQLYSTCQRELKTIKVFSPRIRYSVFALDKNNCSTAKILLNAFRALERRFQPELQPENSDILKSDAAEDLTGNELNVRVLNWTLWHIKQCLRLTREAWEMAMTDATTSLPNNRSARQVLKQMLGCYRETGTPFSILLLDSDNLKAYNWEFGYREGDRLIRELAGHLKSVVRAKDFVARWMVGDEFLVVLPATGQLEAKKVAERIRDSIEASFATWPLPVTVSVGVATCPEDGETLEELLNNVENAIHRAKQKGKNQIAVSARSRSCTVRSGPALSDRTQEPR